MESDRILRCAALTLSLIWACAARGEDSPQAFSQTIPLATAGKAPYYRVTLPLAAYLSSSHMNLRDLRVFNSRGEAVPFARLATTGRQEERTRAQALRWFPLHAQGAGVAGDTSVRLSIRQRTDGSLIELESRADPASAAKDSPVMAYVIDASQLTSGEKLSALTLDWAGNDKAFHQLDVEASADLQNWRNLRRGVQLARLDFAGERIDHRQIALDEFGERYLRLQWRSPATAPQLTAVSATITTSQWRQPAAIWSSPQPGAAVQTEALTEYRYRLPATLHVSQIRVQLPESNAVLPLEVLRPARDRRPASVLARGVLFRIDNKGQPWSRDEIALPGGAVDELILRFDARSGATTRYAGQAPQLSFAIVPDEIVFLASGEPPFSLATGKADAQDAALAPATLVPGYGTTAAPDVAQATPLSALSPTAARPAANAGSADPAKGKTLLLWSVLGVGVLAMGAMAWQLLTQMKAQGSDKPK